MIVKIKYKVCGSPITDTYTDYNVAMHKAMSMYDMEDDYETKIEYVDVDGTKLLYGTPEFEKEMSIARGEY
jgi:hypothetical protein